MKISGKSYDSGGSIIHSENFYAKALTEKVGKSLIAAKQIYLIHIIRIVIHYWLVVTCTLYSI